MFQFFYLQQNLDIQHQEESTTAHYTANKVQCVLYPVVIKFKVEGDDTVRKGGIAFLSTDRLHDFQVCRLFVVFLTTNYSFQQVTLFEQRIFKYMRDRYGIRPRIWHRWSDQVRFLESAMFDTCISSQCAQQFKSCFVLERLRTAGRDLDLEPGSVVHFHHYEVIPNFKGRIIHPNVDLAPVGAKNTDKI